MTSAERFRTAWTELACDARADSVLLPVQLSQACVRVLPAVGAGISVMNALRVPVGASDSTASTAERLQVTVGEGPCLLAHETRRPVAATESSIQERWPAFHGEFIVQTPYRSVASMPLSVGADRLGALDLYFDQPEGVTALRLSDAIAIAEQISSAMSDTPSVITSFGIRQPSWLTGPDAQRRMEVWQAIGRVSVAHRLDADDALSLLRAHAYTSGRDLDDLAADIVSGLVPTEELLR